MFCSPCGIGAFVTGYLVRIDHAGTRNHFDDYCRCGSNSRDFAGRPYCGILTNWS